METMETRAVDHSTIKIKISVEHRVPFWTLAPIAIMLVLANWPNLFDLLRWLTQ